MSLIVQKFGGSSVADTHHVFNVAKKIVSCYKEGNDIIVVVSAQGDTTDDLIKIAKLLDQSFIKVMKQDLEIINYSLMVLVKISIFCFTKK